MNLTESIVKDSALECFGELGYAVWHGLHHALGELASKRDSLGKVLLVERLHGVIWRLNLATPEEVSTCAVPSDRPSDEPAFATAQRERRLRS